MKDTIKESAQKIPMTIRFDPRVHETLVKEAAAADITLNKLVSIKCGEKSLLDIIKFAVREVLEERGGL